MLIKVVPTPRATMSQDFHAAYREAWEIRRFTGSTDTGPLVATFERRGLAREWIHDPAGWRVLRHQWRTGGDPDPPSHALKASASRRLPRLLHSILSKKSR